MRTLNKVQKVSKPDAAKLCRMDGKTEGKNGEREKMENEEEKNEYYGPKGQPAVKLGHRIRYKRSNR